jgi:hypothetical protein
MKFRLQMTTLEAICLIEMGAYPSQLILKWPKVFPFVIGFGMMIATKLSG